MISLYGASVRQPVSVMNLGQLFLAHFDAVTCRLDQRELSSMTFKLSLQIHLDLPHAVQFFVMELSL